MKCSLLLVAAPLACFMGVTSLEQKPTQNLTCEATAVQVIQRELFLRPLLSRDTFTPIFTAVVCRGTGLCAEIRQTGIPTYKLKRFLLLCPGL